MIEFLLGLLFGFAFRGLLLGSMAHLAKFLYPRLTRKQIELILSPPKLA